MGLFDRFRRVDLAATQQPRRSLLGAALRLNDPTVQKRQAALKATDWQRRAWDMFNTVGLVHYPYSQSADAAARVRLFLGVEPTPGEAAIPIMDAVNEVDGVTQSFADAMSATFDRVQSIEGGRAELQREGLLNLKVAGDLALIAEETDQGEDFYVVSVAALKAKRGADGTSVYTILDHPGDTKGRDLDPDRSTIIRIWRRHGQYARVADSNMRALLDDCEELLLAKAASRAKAQSRVAGAGIIVLDKGVKFDDGKFDAKVLGEMMSAAIGDPGSAAAVVPPILEFDGHALPGGVKDALHHMTLDRPSSAEEVARYQEVVLSIARGLDAPPEYVLGLGDTSTYANAKVISKENYEAHLAPTVGILADGIAAGWVRPSGMEMGFAAELVRKVGVFADPGSILSTPEPKSARVGAPSLLFAQIMKHNEARADYGLPPVEDGDRFLDIEEIAALRGAGSTRGGGDEGSGDNPNAGDQTLAVLHPQAITAASTPANPLADLGPTLGEIDRRLLDRTLTLASAALDSALGQAGARLRSQASRGPKPPYKAKVQGVPAHEVPGALGADAVKALTADAGTDPLFDGAFDRFRDQWDATVAKAQRDADEAVLAYRSDPYDTEALEAEREEDRNAGWAWLLAALVTIAGRRLLDPTSVEPPDGEYDDTLGISGGPIRDALLVAGGGSVTAGTAAAGSPEVSGLVATGPRTMDLARAALNAIGEEWTWVYGYPARPFPPHAALDGLVFSDWRDERLLNTNGWPANEYFHGGDHPGCSCLCVPTLRLPEGFSLAASALPTAQHA